MAKMHLMMKARWWVTPFMYLCKVDAYAKLPREKHVDTLANFIVDYGYKIKAK